MNQITPERISIHDKAEYLPQLPEGPFVRLSNRSILCFDRPGGRMLRSTDEGRSWESLDIGVDGVAFAETGALLETREGNLVFAGANVRAKHWTWDDKICDMPGARLPTVVMRSTDGGETWQDVQTLHSDWTGATRDIIQTKSGRIVFTSMKGLTNPGRHSVMTYASEDDGRTWSASNVVDLGGNGHHDGATEATLVELNDGRLVKYIRTNWGKFWIAESHDEGDHWHPIGPASFEASSAPGMLTRLTSGEISMCYNPCDPLDGDPAPYYSGDRQFSAIPVKNFRRELLIRLSNDETRTWSDPVMIARRDDREISYPYVFEAEPGVLWITTHRFDLRIKIRVSDLKEIF